MVSRHDTVPSRSEISDKYPPTTVLLVQAAVPSLFIMTRADLPYARATDSRACRGNIVATSSGNLCLKYGLTLT